MKKDLTILIPTRNRPGRLRRLLDYYGNEGLGCKLIVADSSDEKAREINEETIKSLRGGLIISFKYFSSDVGLNSKILSAVSGVDTDFVVICADDDFLVPACLNKCVEFLKDNPDYSAAKGHTVSFRVNRLNGTEPETDCKFYLRHDAISLEGDKAVDRLPSHMFNYKPTFYAVHRTHQWADCLDYAVKYTKDCRFGELLLSCLTLIQGKVAFLDVPYDVRERHDKNISIIDWESWYDQIVSEDFSERYVKFRECLVKGIVGAEGRDEKEARDCVNKAMLCYFGKVLWGYRSRVEAEWTEKENAPLAPTNNIRELIKRVPVIGALVTRAGQAVHRISTPKIIEDPIENHPEIVRIRKIVLKHAKNISEAGNF